MMTSTILSPQMHMLSVQQYSEMRLDASVTRSHVEVTMEVSLCSHSRCWMTVRWIQIDLFSICCANCDHATLVLSKGWLAQRWDCWSVLDKMEWCECGTWKTRVACISLWATRCGSEVYGPMVFDLWVMVQTTLSLFTTSLIQSPLKSVRRIQ